VNAPSDDAEGMPSRIGEDPPPVLMRLMIRLARAQLQQPGLGLVQGHDVEAKGRALVAGIVGGVCDVQRYMASLLDCMATLLSGSWPFWALDSVS
jgi:hypothetical protein